ncbi:hypothetical protein R84981_003007 [Carnimonas sp. R-84981]|uniref:lambda-exonuclease family protein n=1 Tax=Carnimonas bestiolae TaxID=3402172 RepID=UPI003EDB8CC7
MKTLSGIIQGTPAWHAVRAESLTASEAPAMMGVSKYQTRSDLLQQKFTGVIPDVTPAQQRIFDKGHAAENAARPIAERIIDEELYPCTALSDENDKILASFDGCTMLADVVWEHKLINAKLRTATAETIEEHYKVQMDQQLYVSGAERCLFMASDGTENDINYFWYERDDARIEALLSGWAQFEDDLSKYQPETATVEAVGTAPDSLPTLSIQLQGGVKASNLPAFKDAASSLIAGIKTKLSTDQDFADADSSVKWLKKGEKQLDSAKENALQQTITISELFSTIDDLREQMRQKRLQLEKLVKAEKENRRNEILRAAQASFSAWLEDQHSPVYCEPGIDIAGAMKGKKTIASLKSAADDEVARAKIEVTRAIEAVKSNEKLLAEQGDGYEFLFSDRDQLLIKAPDDLVATIKARIADHKEREEARLKAERERIQQEEARKVKEPPAEADQEPQLKTDSAGYVTSSPQHHAQQAETVTIRRSEYETIKHNSDLLCELIALGVDSWEGYEIALQNIEKSEQVA